MSKNIKQVDHALAYVLRICRCFVIDEPSHIIIPENISLEDIWKTIQKHKVQAIVYEVDNKFNLGLPKPFRAKLNKRKTRMLMQKLFLINEMTSIQEAHKERGMYIIPYKGIAIGIFFYKDITQRDFNDIDFAIEEKNISKSAEVMKSLGYEELKEESDFSVPNRSRSYHIDYSWVKYGDNGRVICNSEIHWQPTNSALFIPDQFKELKKATKPTRVLTEEIQLFSKIDNAYFMILHHGLVDNWFQLRHLVDLVVALKELSSDEVSELKEKLSKANVLMAFYYGVQLSRDLLNVELDVVETPKLHFYKQYLKAFKSGEYVGKWSENKFKLFYYLLMNDNHAARGRSLIKFLKYLLKEKKFKYLTSIKGK